MNLSGIDHLFVLDIRAQVVNAYRLNGVGNAAVNAVFPRTERNVATIPKIVGIAAFV
jgi:predicted acetyltransferase